jgi:hypothetical protein
MKAGLVLLQRISPVPGTKRPFVDVRYSVAMEGKADLNRAVVNRRE